MLKINYLPSKKNFKKSAMLIAADSFSNQNRTKTNIFQD